MFANLQKILTFHHRLFKNVKNKYVTLFFLSYPFSFFRIEGNFSTTSIFEGFNLINFVVFVVFYIYEQIQNLYFK